MLKITKNRFYLVPILMRTFDLLEYLSGSSVPLKTNEISSATGVAPTTTLNSLLWNQARSVSKWWVVVYLISIFVAANPKSNTAEEPAHAWKASWITSPDAPLKDECVLHFRKEIELTSAPARFVIYVSADNQYLLKVNGKYVGTGPSHSDVQHWKYATYDIAPLLRQGKNLVSATVWNFGENAPVRQISDRIGFLIDGDPTNEIDIHSDHTWGVAVEKGLVTLPTPPEIRRSYYVASPAEKLDASIFNWAWDDPDANVQDGGAWKYATIVGRASPRGMMFAQTEWQLIPDILPLMERTEEDSGKVVRVTGLDSSAEFPKATLTIPSHQEASILIDAGHLTTAYPELMFSKGRGAEITVTYAEALYDAQGKKGNRNEIENKHIMGIYDKMYPNGDAQRVFTPLDWRTWRYLQIDVKTGDDDLDLNSLRTWFTAYPFKEAATFASDDPSLKAIWDVGWRTARLCAHDTYMDTPYWERLQYTGDTRVQALISYVVGGDDRLGRQAIEAFHNSTISDGITLSHYPASAFQIIPGFSLYWIGMVHDFWMYRNDPEFVRAQLPVVRSTIAWFQAKQNKNGLLGKLPWWPFVDWSDGFPIGIPPQDAEGDSAVLSLQFVEALRYASEMEAAGGNKDLARQDSAQAAAVADAVRRLCWSKEFGLIADTPEKNRYSQHANAFAVWLDVIPKNDQQAVLNKIMSVSDPTFTAKDVPPKLSVASYYYRFYLARALVHAGLGSRYLETLGPWKTMLANGMTTWAERPEPTRSDSHAWSSHPNYDFLSTVAGIVPAASEFKSVRIEPQLGSLKHVDATLPSPLGAITVVVDLGSSVSHAIVTLPDGMGGKFIWNGKDYALSEGKREFSLPAAVH
jgi:alpha-L-rhamnosidase